MAEGSTVPALTDNQVRHLLAVMSHADELLASAERALEEPRSPFPRLKLDVAQEERARVVAFVAVARERMAAVCDRLGVLRPEPTISARWAVETALDFASITFADLEPGTMRGYGPVPSALAQELVAISAWLQELMRRGIALVHAPDERPSLSSERREGSANEARTRSQAANVAAEEGG
jgi:hypothetical protein